MPLFRKPRRDTDFADEVASHIAHETDRLIQEGHAPEEAGRRARSLFGNPALARERFRESRRWVWLDQLRQDLRAAVRGAWRHRAASLVAVLSLAAGIGATATTEAVRDALFRNPPPLYQDPARLSRVRIGRPDQPVSPVGNDVPGPLFAIWRDALGPRVAASAGGPSREIRVGDRIERVNTRTATSGFLDVLGVGPSIGTGFRDAADAANQVLLADRIWRELFDARTDVTGSTFWLDDRLYTVAGVLPERFWFTDTAPAVWLLLDAPGAERADTVQVVVRRERDESEPMLASRLEPGLRAYAGTLDETTREMRLSVGGVEGTPIGNQMSFVLPYLFGTAAFLVLLIACANVAVLMFAQWSSREHEIAIRAAIGGSRRRLVRALLTESILFAVVGGLLGLGFTYGLFDVVAARMGRDGVLLFDLAIRPRVVLNATALSLVAGVLVGLAPAWYETRRLQGNPLTTIRTSDRVRQRWRHGLVVFEVAVTMALLVVTMSMIDAFFRVTATDVGFDRTALVATSVQRQAGANPSAILEAVRSVPGVRAVAASTGRPYVSPPRRGVVNVGSVDGPSVPVEFAAISPGFFDVLGVPLRAGRAFTDTEDSSRSVIVTEAFARALPAGANPLGQVVVIDRIPYDVVGVVADYANRAFQADRFGPKVFTPLPLSRPAERIDLLLRLAGAPAAIGMSLPRAVRAAAPGATASRPTSLDDVVTVMGQEMLTASAPLVPLIAVGLLLTGAGVYGVLAFAIARRSRELAIRLAIGATRSDVAALVVRHGLRLVVAGTIAGAGLTFALSRVVRANGGAGSFLDPSWSSFVTPVCVLASMAAVAIWVPARRAMRVEPASLLRGA